MFEKYLLALAKHGSLWGKELKHLAYVDHGGITE
jgi:hypothetical protein